MEELCLLGYTPENEEESAILTEEWRDFQDILFRPAWAAKGIVRRSLALFRLKMPLLPKKSAWKSCW